jgi:DNA polymerase-3 subunit delta'
MAKAPAPPPAEEPAAYPAPRANPRLLDQGAAEAVLLRAAKSGRLPHAWLLTGPRGVGKATLAYRFTRFLLAGGAAAEDAGPGLFGAPPPPRDLALPAGHPMFRRVASAGHPDLLTLERTLNDKGKLRSEIVIEDVRTAVDRLHHTPAEGGWRILVIDSADELNRNAANALLKILEEPAPRSLMLLVSHAPGALLPTIRSRCCHLALAPLPPATVGRLLGDYAPELEPDERAALVGLADGSIGRALDLVEAGGLELYRELVALLSTLPRLDIQRTHAFAESLGRAGDGRAFATAMELLGWWLARLVREGALGRQPAPVVPEEQGLAARLAGSLRLADWLALWEKLTRLVARTDRVNLDRKQVAMTAFLEIEALVAA